jgi:hypothetical protein
MKNLVVLFVLSLYVSSCHSDKVVPEEHTAILIVKDSLKEGIYYAKDSSLVSGLVSIRDTIHTFNIPLTVVEVRMMYEYPWHAFPIDSIGKVTYNYIPDSGNVYPKQHTGAIYESLGDDEGNNDEDN